MNGQACEADVDRLHSALMESPTHQENILDSNVAYLVVGLFIGTGEGQGGTQDALFLTQNFASTTQSGSVQDVVDGQTVTTRYIYGEPVLGKSELIPDADETPTVDDDALGEDEGPGAQDDREQEPQATLEGSSFVATAAFVNRHHRDVVTL